MKRGKTGRNLQAEALIGIMLMKGLIEVAVDDYIIGTYYRITPKGRACARKFARAAQ